MYCPNCGAINSTEQTFCRGCGLNLETISSALVEQKPQTPTEMLDLEERRLERFGNVAFTGFGIVLLLAIASIIYMIVTKFILSGSQPLAGVLLAGFIVFAGLALGYVVWAESLKEKRAKLMKRGRENLSEIESPDLQLPPSTIEPAASVTEHTTRDLSGSRRQ